MKNLVVILSNGCFPSHEIPRSILLNAKMIICTDGSADNLLSFGKIPDVIIGDMDSIQSTPRAGIKIVHLSEQNNSDLEKAIIWCDDQNIKNVVIVGSQGMRDDHGLSSLLIQSAWTHKMSIQLVTDYFIIDCISRDATFSSFEGQTISLFPIDSETRITTTGLKFPLTDEKLSSPSQGVSNLSVGNTISITTTKPVWVFRSHE